MDVYRVDVVCGIFATGLKHRAGSDTLIVLGSGQACWGLRCAVLGTCTR
jgi:hypothetical protein